jgi:hypothetical protein
MYFLMLGVEHIKPLHILQILCHYIPEDSFLLTCSLGGSQSLNLHLLYLYDSLYMHGIVSLSTRLLSPERKKSLYPLDRRLKVPHTRSGRFGEEKSFAPIGIRTLDRPARNLFIPCTDYDCCMSTAFFRGGLVKGALLSVFHFCITFC